MRELEAMTTPNSSGVRFMSRRQVLEATTLSYPMIWRKMREGNSPEVAKLMAARAGSLAKSKSGSFRGL
jgi:predicted DNA-binding transcriptional regulator AlpA